MTANRGSGASKGGAAQRGDDPLPHRVIPRDPEAFSAFVAALVKAGERYAKGRPPGRANRGAGARKRPAKGKGERPKP